jgi:hypothetical protein
MSGGTVIAPNAPRILSRSRQALGIVGDLALAVAVLWGGLLALFAVAGLIRLAWAIASR